MASENTCSLSAQFCLHVLPVFRWRSARWRSALESTSHGSSKRGEVADSLHYPNSGWGTQGLGSGTMVVQSCLRVSISYLCQRAAADLCVSESEQEHQERLLWTLGGGAAVVSTASISPFSRGNRTRGRDQRPTGGPEDLRCHGLIEDRQASDRK